MKYSKKFGYILQCCKDNSSFGDCELILMDNMNIPDNFKKTRI